MAVPTTFAELSTTAASNPPADSEGVSQGDDQLRAVYAFIRSLYEGSTNGQIAFPATQNASSNVNTLDDYEEGTWTPTDASGAGLSLTPTNCNYVKIGKLVTAMIGQISYPATADGTAAAIGGLPFTVGGGAGYISGAHFATTSGFVDVGGLVSQGETKIVLYDKASGSTATNAEISGNTLYGVSLSYIASA